MANSARKAQIIPGNYGAPGSGPSQLGLARPIIANYDPTTIDQCDGLGQIWINSTSAASWIAGKNSSGTTTWTSVGSSISPSVSSITITGAMPGSLTVNNLLTGAVVSSNPSTTSGAIQSVALANGQLLIGNGAVPVAANLTAGTGISITNGAGTITIAAVGDVDTWSAKAAGFNAAAANGYVITAGSSSVTATLPTNNALGDEITIMYPSATAGDRLVVSTSGARIRIFGAASGTAYTTLTWPLCNGTGAANPSCTLVCTTASATVPVWTALDMNGNPVGS